MSGRPASIQHKGFGLIDLMLGMAVSMLMLLLVVRAVNQIGEGRTAQRQGDRLYQGAIALQTYIERSGLSIIGSGSVAGFSNAYAPSIAELKNAGYLPPFWSPNLPFGGIAQFSVRRGPNNDLLGLVCDTSSLTRSGAVAPDLAAKIAKAAHGRGLMTSQAAPTILNGPGMTNVQAPLNAPAIACAWAYLPAPA